MNDCRFPVKIEKSYDEEKTGKWIVEGWAVISDKVDRNNPKVIISDEAVRCAIKDLDVNDILFFEHDKTNAIGKIVDKRYEKGKGLWIKAEISKTANKIWQLIQEKILTGFSIGAKVLDYVDEAIEKTGEFVRKVLKLYLYDISVVALPANLETRIANYYIEKSFKRNDEKKGGEDNMTDQETIAKLTEDLRIANEGLVTTKGLLAEKEVAEAKIKEEESKAEVIALSLSDVDIAKAKAEGYDAYYAYSQEQVVSALKKMLASTSITQIKAAITKLIELLTGKSYYYYQKPEDTKSDLEKSIEENEIADVEKSVYTDFMGKCMKEGKDMKACSIEYREKYPKATVKKEFDNEALTALKTQLEEITKKLITDEKVTQIVKDLFKQLPDPIEIKQSLVLTKQKEAEDILSKASTEERMKAKLGKMYDK